MICDLLILYFLATFYLEAEQNAIYSIFGVVDLGPRNTNARMQSGFMHYVYRIYVRAYIVEVMSRTIFLS